MTIKVFVLNGPNLNLLGLREPEIYGTKTLEDIGSRCRDIGDELGLSVDFRQSNHEGQLVEWLHEARDAAQAVVINAAAYTHTSVAIHDALRAYNGHKTELHISNPHTRESFRHVSFVAPAVDAIVAGLGVNGYFYALETLAQLLPKAEQE